MAALTDLCLMPFAGIVVAVAAVLAIAALWLVWTLAKRAIAFLNPPSRKAAPPPVAAPVAPLWPIEQISKVSGNEWIAAMVQSYGGIEAMEERASASAAGPMRHADERRTRGDYQRLSHRRPRDR